MSVPPALPHLLDARRNALLALDGTVRVELARAAQAWGLADVTIALTIYDQIYGRTPRLGGHWTLFRAGATLDGHEVATLSVALEFADGRPVDFWVSGAEDEVIAGGCTSAALGEALAQCGGPLRQVTSLVPDRATAPALLTALIVPYTAGPVGSLN
jgi:hypothetical protein